MRGSDPGELNIEIGEPVPVSRISNLSGLEEREVETQLRRASKRHFESFGIRPFEIEFDPEMGELIRATSQVGIVRTESFLIRIRPTIAGLGLGKCIGMAQRCGYGFLARYNEEIVRQRISDAEEYSAIEFFGQSLMAAVATILANGIQKRYVERAEEAGKLGGELRLQESVQAGAVRRKPIANETVADLDIPPNRYVLSALFRCRDGAKSGAIVRWASFLIDSFSGVTPVDTEADAVLPTDPSLTSPRDDYKQALLLARLVLEGSSVAAGTAEGFVPLFTLDMNQLFEKYVSILLQQYLPEGKFDVQLQIPAKHPMRPEDAEKEFVPDIVVRRAKERSPALVLDVKNKYGVGAARGGRRIPNPDLFQLSYYCHALGSKVAILVFPGNARNATRYPLRAAEGESAFEAKRAKAFETLFANTRLEMFPDDARVRLSLFKWVVDLTGSVRNTGRSVAELAQFVAHVLDGRVVVP